MPYGAPFGTAQQAWRWLTGTPDSVPAVKASCVSRNLERAFALATQRRIRGTGGLLEGAIRRTISHGTCPNDTNIIVDRS